MTTDLVAVQSGAVSTLELAPQAWKLAEKIAMTDFVPPALRGKPEAVMACMLAGHEAGISPMQALSKIHIIEGRPAMAAELMRAIVLRHGHELNYDEMTTTKVVASGRRRGEERWTTVTWTMDDAKRGNLDGKQNWRKWPRAMLIARATAELCRLKFPDVLAGISHTVEELSDGDLTDGQIVDFGPPEIVGDQPAEPARPKTRASRAIARQAPQDEPAPAPAPPRSSVPTLPGEDTPQAATPPAAPVAPVARPQAAPADGDDWPDGDWPAGEFPTTPDPQQQRRYSGPQIIAMKIEQRWKVKGNTAQAKAERLEVISAIVGRPIESSKDLTSAEVQQVIEHLDALPDDAPRPTIAAAEPHPVTVEQLREIRRLYRSMDMGDQTDISGALLELDHPLEAHDELDAADAARLIELLGGLDQGTLTFDLDADGNVLGVKPADSGPPPENG